MSLSTYIRKNYARLTAAYATEVHGTDNVLCIYTYGPGVTHCVSHAANTGCAELKIVSGDDMSINNLLAMAQY